MHLSSIIKLGLGLASGAFIGTGLALAIAERKRKQKEKGLEGSEKIALDFQLLLDAFKLPQKRFQEALEAAIEENSNATFKFMEEYKKNIEKARERGGLK